MRMTTSVLCCLLLLSVFFFSSLAVATDDQTRARLEQLRRAVQSIGLPQDEAPPPPTVQLPVAPAQMCWTPHGEFSAVGQATEVPFGPRGLAARWVYGPVNQEAAVDIFWHYNGQEAALSAGEGVLSATVDHVANGIVKSEGPLLPGRYEVHFEVNGVRRAAGKLTILPPAPAGNKSPQALYTEGLQAVQEAMAKVDAGQAQPAAQAATRALPGLATLMLAQPQEKNPQGLYELAQAIIALGKMDALAPLKQPELVLDWALRCYSHARTAQKVSADPALQTAARQFADTLEKALPALRKACEQ